MREQKVGYNGPEDIRRPKRTSTRALPLCVHITNVIVTASFCHYLCGIRAKIATLENSIYFALEQEQKNKKNFLSDYDKGKMAGGKEIELHE